MADFVSDYRPVATVNKAHPFFIPDISPTFTLI